MQYFLISGFGAGLLFFFPLSLVENAAYTVFVLFRGERKNSTKTLLFGTLIIAAISFSIALALIFRDPFKLSNILSFATVLIWSWYFVLVPQLIVRKVLLRIPPNRRIGMIVLRAILTVVLPAGLYVVHAILGSILGIPSD